MFDIITKREWVYGSICSIVGLIMLYDFGTNNSIPIYIMLPVDILGAIFFIAFFRSMIEESKIPNDEVVQQ